MILYLWLFVALVIHAVLLYGLLIIIKGGIVLISLANAFLMSIWGGSNGRADSIHRVRRRENMDGDR